MWHRYMMCTVTMAKISCCYRFTLVVPSGSRCTLNFISGRWMSCPEVELLYSKLSDKRVWYHKQCGTLKANGTENSNLCFCVFLRSIEHVIWDCNILILNVFLYLPVSLFLSLSPSLPPSLPLSLFLSLPLWPPFLFQARTYPYVCVPQALLQLVSKMWLQHTCWGWSSLLGRSGNFLAYPSHLRLISCHEDELPCIDIPHKYAWYHGNWRKAQDYT